MMRVHEYERFRRERAFQAKIASLINLGLKVNFVLLLVYALFSKVKSEALSDKTYIYALIFNIASIIFFLVAAGLDEDSLVKEFLIWLGTAFLCSLVATYFLQHVRGNNEYVIAVVSLVLTFIVLTWLKRAHAE